jgi:PPM family protein phosphatase
MSVLCTTCGQTSQDAEFCDHCNADLGSKGQDLPPEQCPLLGPGPMLTLEHRRMLSFPEASIVVRKDGNALRIHWISAAHWQEHGASIERRLATDLPCLPKGRLIAEGEGRWLAYEASVDPGFDYAAPPLAEPFAELERLALAIRSVTNLMEELHHHALVWLNFDPGALEGGREAPLRITNLDLQLFPLKAMPERVRVHPNYAAPEIVQYRASLIGPRSDVFHLALFAYYWLARQLPDGLPGNGLEQFHYAIPFLRIFAPNLPEGIIPVVARGLELQPDDRYATPSAFADAFDAAIAWAKQRRASMASIRWDIGADTRAGRSKAELQRGNEDAILLKEDESSALVAVADGVSTCDIGSGGLASVMTTIVVENAFADGCTHEAFQETIAGATTRSSQGLLEWALAHHCRAELEAGKDLMGTTLTVGWIQGRELSIANLGDSRGYLITDRGIEQLTVDGDLASDLLARGATPAEVKELGTMGRSLRECVGGCIRKPNGELSILPESRQPRVSRWPLVPGDVIVLCTDGLVEEGYFLEPQAVSDIVRTNADLSAAALALKLGEAADALQRVPTALEPDGFGDNVTCVVVKIH